MKLEIGSKSWNYKLCATLKVKGFKLGSQIHECWLNRPMLKDISLFFFSQVSWVH